MRLKEKELEAIQNTFKEVFRDGKIYLFGSRTDDSLRGGDIDLYIVTEHKKNIMEKKIDFLVRLKQRIGDQKIDVVISKDSGGIIDREALKYGIELC